MARKKNNWCDKHNCEKDGFRPSRNRFYCKQCESEQNKRYREKNKERLALNKKIWRENNFERVSAKEKEYKENNPEKVIETQIKYYNNNIEKMKEKNKKYRVENPAKMHLYAAQRRVLEENAEGSFTNEEWLEVCMMQGYKCNMCFYWFEKLSIDHIIPLSRGGTNYIDNIQGLCRKCNSSKGDKLIY